MSRKFLTNIDLNSNELRNGVIHNLASDPSGKAGQIYYNTVANELRFFDGGASAWVSLTSVDAEIIEDAVAELLSAGTGIGLEYNDGSGTLTVTNTGVTGIQGTENEVSVSASTGLITVGLPDDVTIGGDLSVLGDLTVSGSVTYINTEQLLVEDNVITLNSGLTNFQGGTNAGIEVERGYQVNASLLWNNNDARWEAGILGEEVEISLAGHTHQAADITDFYAEVDNEIDNYLVGIGAIYIGSGSVGIDINALSQDLVNNNFTKGLTATNSLLTPVGGVCTWTIGHYVGSKRYHVRVYENSSPYAEVEPDIERGDEEVTIKINSGSNIAANTYTAVIIG